MQQKQSWRCQLNSLENINYNFKVCLVYIFSTQTNITKTLQTKLHKVTVLNGKTNRKLKSITSSIVYSYLRSEPGLI